MSERPRVLLCSFEIYPGPTGGARRLAAYLPALSERFDVVALTVKTPELSHIERVREARLLRVPVSSDLLTRVQTFERAVRRQLQSEEYALVHFTGPFGGYPLCEEREKHGYRLVYEAMGFPSQELPAQHPELEKDRRLLSRFRRQELFCLMNADRVLTGSEVTRSFVRSLGVAEDAVRVMRAPVELGKKASEALGPPDGNPLRVLYLGSQAPYQGLATLLRGVAGTVGRAEVRLRIVGPRHPDWQPQLQELASELKIDDRVELMPPVPAAELGKLLSDTDVGVVPLEDVARNREQGGALAKASDYLGAGRPVLAADLPLTRGLLPEAGTAFFPPGDATLLADRLVALANDVPQRMAMGQASLRYAREHLDASNIHADLFAVYEELLGGVAPRPAKPRGPKEETKALAFPDLPLDPAPPVRPEPARRTPSERPGFTPQPPRPPAPPVDLLKATLPVFEPPPEKPAPSPVRTPVRTPAVPPPPRAGRPSAPSGPPPVLTPVPAPPRAAPPVLTPAPSRAAAPALPRAPTPPRPQPAPAAPPLPPRVQASGPPPDVHALPDPDDLEEISSDEVLEAEPAHDASPADARAAEDLHEVHEVDDFEPLDEVDEVQAVEDPEAIEEILEADADVDIPPSLPGGLIDPWLSQVLFGYCPPDSSHFTRPTPPTNFPGRDQPASGRTASSPGTPAQPLSKPAGV